MLSHKVQTMPEFNIHHSKLNILTALLSDSEELIKILTSIVKTGPPCVHELEQTDRSVEFDQKVDIAIRILISTDK